MDALERHIYRLLLESVTKHLPSSVGRIRSKGDKADVSSADRAALKRELEQMPTHDVRATIRRTAQHIGSNAPYTGFTLEDMRWLMAAAQAENRKRKTEKYNPYHDKSGRFTSGSGGGTPRTPSTPKGDRPAGHRIGITGYGRAVSGSERWDVISRQATSVVRSNKLPDGSTLEAHLVRQYVQDRMSLYPHMRNASYLVHKPKGAQSNKAVVRGFSERYGADRAFDEALAAAGLPVPPRGPIKQGLWTWD